MTTRTIKVSPETYALIAAQTQPGYEFASTAKLCPDGWYEFPMDEDAYDRLEIFRHKGESHDECIQRIIAMRTGRVS